MASSSVFGKGCLSQLGPAGKGYVFMRKRNGGSKRRSNSSRRLMVANSSSVATTKLESTTQNGSVVEDLAALSSYSIPSSVTLFNPLASSACVPPGRTLLIYFPGMDCTGQGIRPQLQSLVASDYDVRCVYIPDGDRSSWSSLTNTLSPLLRNAAMGYETVVLIGESFGGSLALHLARAASDVVSCLILVNPATNFAQSNRIASFFGHTGVLGLFPQPLYAIAQDILLPLMVKRNRISSTYEDLLSPVDFVTAECAAFRLSILNDQLELSDANLRSIETPTLILSSAKDRMLSSLAEGVRLQSLLPNAKRVILPDSGHMALLEDSIDLAAIMRDHGYPPQSKKQSISSSTAIDTIPDEKMDELGGFLGPWRLLTSPLVSGAENLPSASLVGRRSVLFVGNHTIFGVYDSALLLHELFLRGFKCRSLAHPAHWISGVGDLFQKYGSVKANKFEAYRLLKEGQHVLLFPGGAREVCKRRGEEYKLLWKPTTDFVRMAAQFNAIIVPFGVLGGDDAFKLFWDSNEILELPAGDFVRQIYRTLNLDDQNIHPISTLPLSNLPSAIPLPYSIERVYFHFSTFVDTAEPW